MLNKRKISAAIIASALSLSLLLTGCSQGGTTTSDKPNSSQGSASSKQESSKSESSKPESSKPTETSEPESSKPESDKPTESSEPTSQPTASADFTPAMWEVTSNDGKKLYLFGSIHATDGNATVLPDYVENAYQSCDSLAVEIDINNVDSMAMAEKLVYKDGTTIKDHISKETYDACVKFLKENRSYAPLYDNFKPMMWISLMENAIYKNAKINANNSMESIMLEKANKDKKEVLEVESMEIQLDVFEGLSDELIDIMLASYIETDPQEVADSLNELYSDWYHGKEISDDDDTDLDELPENLRKDYENYNDKMLKNRNVGMADKAEQYMKDGKQTFFMVGAAHMYGDDGLVSLLTKRGYKVERVSPSAENSEMQKAA